MVKVKALTIQEMIDDPEEWFKFVRIHDTQYGWAWRFGYMQTGHENMVGEDEVPLSAGFFGLNGRQVTLPEHINLPNYETILGINASKEDYKSIPLLFEGHSEVINGKYVKSGIRGDNDSPVDGNEGEHGSSSS